MTNLFSEKDPHGFCQEQRLPQYKIRIHIQDIRPRKEGKVVTHRGQRYRHRVHRRIQITAYREKFRCHRIIVCRRKRKYRNRNTEANPCLGISAISPLRMQRERGFFICVCHSKHRRTFPPFYRYIFLCGIVPNTLYNAF